jgi:hypothetical protein
MGENSGDEVGDVREGPPEQFWDRLRETPL